MIDRYRHLRVVPGPRRPRWHSRSRFLSRRGPLFDLAFILVSVSVALMALGITMAVVGMYYPR